MSTFSFIDATFFTCIPMSNANPVSLCPVNRQEVIVQLYKAIFLLWVLNFRNMRCITQMILGRLTVKSKITVCIKKRTRIGWPWSRFCSSKGSIMITIGINRSKRQIKLMHLSNLKHKQKECYDIWREKRLFFKKMRMIQIKIFYYKYILIIS